MADSVSVSGSERNAAAGSSSRVVCDSCLQSPNDWEKDLLPDRQQKVHWEKKAKDASGLPSSFYNSASLLTFIVAISRPGAPIRTESLL